MASIRRGDLVLLKPVENVASGNRAILSGIPQGPVYESFYIVLGGTTMTKGLLDNLKVTLGDKDLLDCAGSDMDGINAFYRRRSAPNVLEVHFCNPNAKDQLEYDLGSIDTSLLYSSFNMEFLIDQVAVNPSIQVYARRRNEPKTGAAQQLMRAWLKSTYYFAAVQQQDLPFAKGSHGGALIEALHIFNSNSISKLTMLKDGVNLLNQVGVPYPLQSEQAELKRDIQNGLVNIDFCLRDSSNDAVPTLRETSANNQKPTAAVFELKVTNTIADQYTTYTQVITSPANI